MGLSVVVLAVAILAVLVAIFGPRDKIAVQAYAERLGQWVGPIASASLCFLGAWWLGRRVPSGRVLNGFWWARRRQQSTCLHWCRWEADFSCDRSVVRGQAGRRDARRVGQ